MRFHSAFLRSQSDLIVLPEEAFAFISTPASDEILCFSNQENARSESSFRFHPFDTKQPAADVDITQAQHRTIIEAALTDMLHHRLEKVVVSRTKSIPLKRSLNEWLDVYRAMCTTYPAACAVWFTQGKTMWMGATPELLLSKKGNTWRTVAIAGTQPYNAALPLNDHSWKDKEIREQAIVTEYIISSLREAGASHIHASLPYNNQAGPIVHIKTDITFEFDGDKAHILKTLHPTPAVCGFPLAASQVFISQHEPHSRDLYAGYFGVDYANGDADYFVNLRCVRIREDHLTLFAGGGIVQGSDPDKEWEETERKMDVMLSVIQNA